MSDKSHQPGRGLGACDTVTPCHDEDINSQLTITAESLYCSSGRDR